MRSRQFALDAGPARRVVVALAGAEGLEYGTRLLEALARAGIEIHLVLTGAAASALGAEADAARALAAQVHAEGNQAARISSGSFLNRGMIVAPCDGGSVSAIVLGLATNLVYRAADVTLKEHRPLVLGVPAEALGRIPAEVLERAAHVPGLSIVPLGGPVEPAVGALLAQLGIDDVAFVA